MRNEKESPSKGVHRKLLRELNRQRLCYLDSKSGKWKCLTYVTPPKLNSSTIQLKLKGTPGPILTLPYPFQVSKLIAYCYGLGLGAAYWARGLHYRVQRHELSRLKQFGKAIGITPKVIVKLRGRKPQDKERHRRYFREYKVQFPRVVLKFFNAIAGTTSEFYRLPRIPQWLSIPLQKTILSGYLNSKRTHVVFKSHGILSARCTITIRSDIPENGHHPALEFLQQIRELLSLAGVKTVQTHGYKNGRGTQVHRLHAYAPSVIRLQEEFEITQVKFLALQALLSKCQYESTIRQLFNLVWKRGIIHDPCGNETIIEHGFEELHYIILGYLYHLTTSSKDPVVEYTRFEEVFDYSSSVIHKTLYDLEEWGFVSMYMNEKHKEFYQASERYLQRAVYVINRQITTFEQHPSQETGEYQFQCRCGEVMDYLEALTSNNEWKCPHCGGNALTPVSNINYYPQQVATWKAQVTQIEYIIRSKGVI